MRAREEGEGRRIQLKKNDITCAARARERERERERGWEVAWMKPEQAEGNCIRWIGCCADVDERGRDEERERENGKDGDREEREGASLLIGW